MIKKFFTADPDCGCGGTATPVLAPTVPAQPSVDLCAQPAFPTENDPACPISIKSKCVACGITNVPYGITPDMNLAQVLNIMLTHLTP
jgi:hypothetical protein